MGYCYSSVSPDSPLPCSRPGASVLSYCLKLGQDSKASLAKLIATMTTMECIINKDGKYKDNFKASLTEIINYMASDLGLSEKDLEPKVQAKIKALMSGPDSMVSTGDGQNQDKKDEAAKRVEKEKKSKKKGKDKEADDEKDENADVATAPPSKRRRARH